MAKAHRIAFNMCWRPQGAAAAANTQRGPPRQQHRRHAATTARPLLFSMNVDDVCPILREMVQAFAADDDGADDGGGGEMNSSSAPPLNHAILTPQVQPTIGTGIPFVDDTWDS
mmetsp:Transcript_6272/g.23577  ORF Transcript_6272/g.23577 Transcript_6272/m.23577 type:complete len:114 (+) Transcript_6272:1972-2313(+)